jgi:hypothetical protein
MSVPPLNTRFVAAFDDAPIELFEPPLASVADEIPPPLMIVAPVKVLTPERVRIPLPLLSRAPVPEMAPP